MEKVQFFLLDFLVDRHVLFPRFDTESLVRLAIGQIRSEAYDVLLDVGTGSGIIPLSIMKNVPAIRKSYAIDRSRSALKVAALNVQKHGSDLNLLEGDLLRPFLENPSLHDGLAGSSLLVTANLPYIKDGDWANMSEDTVNDPKMALFGGKKDGFGLYRRLFRQLPVLKAKAGLRNLTAICEIGFDQKGIADRFLRNLGADYRFHADTQGIERFIVISF